MGFQGFQQSLAPTVDLGDLRLLVTDRFLESSDFVLQKVSAVRDNGAVKSLRVGQPPHDGIWQFNLRTVVEAKDLFGFGCVLVCETLLVEGQQPLVRKGLVHQLVQHGGQGVCFLLDLRVHGQHPVGPQILSLCVEYLLKTRISRATRFWYGLRHATEPLTREYRVQRVMSNVERSAVIEDADGKIVAARIHQDGSWLVYVDAGPGGEPMRLRLSLTDDSDAHRKP